MTQLVVEQPAALVVVDVQSGFLGDDTRHLPGRIGRFLDRYAGQFELAVATCFVNAPGSLYRKVFGASSMTGPPDTDLCPAIADRGLDVRRKETYGVLTGGLCDDVHRRGLERVYLCGIDTDQCVLKTALDAFDSGILPIVLADLCASSAGRETHDAALALLARTIGAQNVVLTGLDPPASERAA